MPNVRKNSNCGQIEVRNLSVVFGANLREVVAIHDLSFSVAPGEFLCLLGTSGCGKSTILNTLAGFVPATSGNVLLDGKPVDSPSPDRGMVFQKHALFPWKTVFGNIAFGLKMKGLEQAEVRRVAQQYIDLVGLRGFEKRYPAELSGGMEQRVGIARALAVDPLVLLMDEPFGSLDAQTRMMMQELLLGVWEKSSKTVVFVTHDVDEAILLADRIIVLTSRPGQVKEEIQVDLERPRKYQHVTTPQFIRIKEHALELIREETARIMQT
ncbi:MAG: ABC transporter ATP-binding protein [Sedimentisphaerales bacterium]|jgi:NitT/TauT family transport system ATP-binding protein